MQIITNDRFEIDLRIDYIQIKKKLFVIYALKLHQGHQNLMEKQECRILNVQELRLQPKAL